MALRRLNEVAKFCTLCLFFLPTMMLAQAGSMTVPGTQGYNTSYTWSTTDITVQATSGTNAWKQMSGLCSAGGLVMDPTSITPWCKGTDGYQYQWDVATHAWDKQTAMGTSAIALAPQGANIFALRAASDCGSPDRGVFKWNASNSTWVRTAAGSCLYTLSAGTDIIGGITMSSGHQHQSWYSSDGGVTWNSWSTGWGSVNISNSLSGCAVTTGGSLYEVTTTSAVALPGIPVGTAVGCLNLSGAIAFTWNTAGSVYLMSDAGGGWNPVSGLTASELTGSSKALLFGLDSAGHAYHWNVFAPSITATVTGTYDNFPMGGLNPPPQHTSHVKINFPHGINTAAASTQTIPYNGAMNNYYSDTAPNCDVFYGDAGSQECVPAVGVDNADCSVAGALPVSDPPQPSGPQESMDVRDYVYDKQDYGPTLFVTGPVSRWVGQVDILTSDGCVIGVPTCPMDARTDIITDWWIYDFVTGDSAGNASAWSAALKGMAASRDGKTAPWLYPVPYEINSDGTKQCNYPPDVPGATIATWHQLDIPPCK